MHERIRISDIRGQIEVKAFMDKVGERVDAIIENHHIECKLDLRTLRYKWQFLDKPVWSLHWVVEVYDPTTYQHIMLCMGEMSIDKLVDGTMEDAAWTVYQTVSKAVRDRGGQAA